MIQVSYEREKKLGFLSLFSNKFIATLILYKAIVDCR